MKENKLSYINFCNFLCVNFGFLGLPDHIRRIGETDVPLDFDTFDASSPGRNLQFL